MGKVEGTPKTDFALLRVLSEASSVDRHRTDLGI